MQTKRVFLKIIVGVLFITSSLFASLEFSPSSFGTGSLNCTNSALKSYIRGITNGNSIRLTETTDGTLLVKVYYPSNPNNSRVIGVVALKKGSTNIKKSRVRTLYEDGGYFDIAKQNISDGSYFITGAFMLDGDSTKNCTFRSRNFSVSKPNHKPTIDSFSVYEDGSGDGRVRARIRVSSQDGVSRVRVHCADNSSYNGSIYENGSSSVGSQNIYLQRDSWKGKRVYCKAEVLDGDGDKADIRSDSVRLSKPNYIPSIDVFNVNEYGLGNGKVKVHMSISSQDSSGICQR